MRQFDRRFEIVGLTAGQFFILETLVKSNSDASNLAQTTGLDRASITNLLNKLEPKRLITRVLDKQDRRRLIVSITPEGKKLYAKIVVLANEFELSIRSKTTGTNLGNFWAILERLTD